MIDFAALGEALEHHGRVVRLVVAEVRGSAPRDAGTSMLIWGDGISGTIGGGRLEFRAIKTARRLLSEGKTQLTERSSLGPGLGQCCGGAVTLVYEVFDAQVLTKARSAVLHKTCYARRVEDSADKMPAMLPSHIAQAEAARTPPATRLSKGWLAEPVWQTQLPVFIYGAGHVGRALALTLDPLEQFTVHLSDVRDDQFDGLPATIGQSWDLLPTDILATAPDEAAHFIMTPEHDYDLELCHRLLSRSFGYAGLIGSATKWARFRPRLKDLGHSEGQINRISCPIGDPGLGKHPQAIAVGVVTQLLRHHAARADVLRSVV